MAKFRYKESLYNRILHFKPSEDNLEEIQSLLDNNTINKPYDKGRTLLHAAAKNGNPELVKALIEKGAQVNILDNMRRTPLHYAAENGRDVACEELISKNAPVNNIDYAGHTPLHLSVINQRHNVVELLVNNKQVYCDAVDYSKRTPPYYACINGDEKLVKKLLENIEVVRVIEGRENFTVLHAAVYTKNLEIVKAILNKGRNKGRELMNWPDSKFGFPLHLAAKLGSKDICELLIDNGSKSYNESAFHKTYEKNFCLPLHFAVNEGHLDLCEYLIDKNKNHLELTVENINQNYPLHIAAEAEKIEIINLLIKKGANTNSRNRRGDNVFNILARKIDQQLNIVDRLIEGQNESEVAKLISLTIKGASGYIKDDNEIWKLVEAEVKRVPEENKVAVMTEVLKSVSNKSRRDKICGFVSAEDREKLKDIKPDSLWKRIVNKIYRPKDYRVSEENYSKIISLKKEEKSEIKKIASPLLGGLKLEGVTNVSVDESQKKKSFVQMIQREDNNKGMANEH
jgi:ankyrin repeat protein